MQTASSPILDYASPRPRTNLRLRSRSIVWIRWDDDGQGVRILERVEALAGAMFGMAFACFVMLIMGTLFVNDVMQKHGVTIDVITVPISIMWSTEAVVLVLVVAQTWRRTSLHARDGVLVLRQINLFGTSVFRWPFHLIDNLSVVPTQQAGTYQLAELQFRVAGETPVHLYTKHLEREVREIRDALVTAMKEPVGQI